MMDVVEADIPGQPVQDTRHIEPRRSFHRCVGWIPFFAARPTGGLEAMLQRKQPDPDYRSDDHYRDVDRQNFSPFLQYRENTKQRQQRRVGEVDRMALAPPAPWRVEWHAVEHDIDQWRQQHVGDQRMASKAMHQAPPTR